MLCQKCHTSLATVRYAEVVNGKVAEIQMCPECLAKQEREAASGFKLSGSAPTPRIRAAAGSTDTTVPKRPCRTCGMDLKEVIQSGRVGCAVCYESFAEQLDAVLRGFHVALRHRGKSPQRDDYRERLRAELRTKRALLRSALKTENFEEAAVQRDEIRALEEKLSAVAAGQG